MSFSTLTDVNNVKSNTKGASVRCYNLIVDNEITVDGGNLINYQAVALPVLYSGNSNSQTKTFYFQRVGRIVNVLIPQVEYTIPGTLGVDPAIPGYFYADISALTDFLPSNINPDGTIYQAESVVNDNLITTGAVGINKTTGHIEIKKVTSGSSGTNFTGTASTSQGIPLQHMLSYFH